MSIPFTPCLPSPLKGSSTLIIHRVSKFETVRPRLRIRDFEESYNEEPHLNVVRQVNTTAGPSK